MPPWVFGAASAVIALAALVHSYLTRRELRRYREDDQRTKRMANFDLASIYAERETSSDREHVWVVAKIVHTGAALARGFRADLEVGESRFRGAPRPDSSLAVIDPGQRLRIMFLVRDTSLFPEGIGRYRRFIATARVVVEYRDDTGDRTQTFTAEDLEKRYRPGDS